MLAAAAAAAATAAAAAAAATVAATAAVAVAALKVLQECSPLKSSRPLSQTFVDIGSGLANIILQMSALKPEFKG